MPGLMDRENIALRAALGIPTALAISRPTFDWNDAVADRGHHSRRAPAATIPLETGAKIIIGPTRHCKQKPWMKIFAADGHCVEYSPGHDAVLDAWRIEQADRLSLMLGMPRQPSPPEPPKDVLERLIEWFRPTPPPVWPEALEHLAKAVARRILQSEPLQMSHCTYRTDMSEHTGWKNGKPNIEEHKSSWMDVGDDVRILRSGGYDVPFGERWNDHDAYMVAHAAWGVVYVPRAAILKAFEQRRSQAFDSSLPLQTGITTGIPIVGNATAARIQQVALRALAVDPDLASENGARIDTLVCDHLPRLLARYDLAARLEPTSTIRNLEDELSAGVETIRSAVEQAVKASAIEARDAFLAELLFLEARHPRAALSDCSIDSSMSTHQPPRLD